MVYDLATKNHMELRNIMYSRRSIKCGGLDPSKFFDRVISVYGNVTFDLITTDNKTGLNIRIEMPHEELLHESLDALIWSSLGVLRGSESYRVSFGITNTKTWKEMISSEREGMLRATLMKEGSDQIISPSESEICIAMPDDLHKICEAYLCWARELSSLTKQI